MDKHLKRLKEINLRVKELLQLDALSDDQRTELTNLIGADSLGGERQRVEASIAQLKLQHEAESRAAALERADIEQRRAAEVEAQRLALTVQPSGRLTSADAPTQNNPYAATVVNLIHVASEDDKKAQRGGYKFLSEMAGDVLKARTTGRVSDRLAFMNDWERKQMSATGMGEAVGSDGAFLIPPEFSTKVMERVYLDAGLLAKTDIYTVNGNSISFPRNNETSRANGSRWGGVTSYFIGEGTQVTGSKPGLGRLSLSLHKLALFGALTDELMSDAQGVAADQYMSRCFSNELNYRISDTIVNGSGSGQPLGMLNAGCKVKVAKESGQAAATVSSANIVKMWSRMWSPCRANSAWYINQDVEPQLQQMTIGTGVANTPVYLPPGGFNTSPYGLVFGRPVIPIEQCQTLGTEGDIILGDLSQWCTAIKAGGPQMAASMHFYFDTDQQALRITFRYDSQPWWISALTPANGTNTLSCVVTLAAR